MSIADSPGRASRRFPWRLAAALGWLAVVVAALPFVWHAARLGLSGLAPGATLEHRLFSTSEPLATAAVFLHMVTGAAITLLAPVQLAGPVRRRWPHLHRATGRIVAAAAVATGLGGLAYIAMHGTVGGRLMDLGFGLYGALVVLAAVQTVRHARAGDLARHRAWALRLFVLAIGSLLYRVHYGLWYWLTGGIAAERDFSGLFDKVQVFAFFVPYLIIVELYLRARPRRPSLS